MASEHVQEFCSTCGSRLETETVDGRERSVCTECSTVAWKNPKPVAWVLVETGETFLLVKRANKPEKGLWDIPGGFLEIDESFEEAGIRELEEETGVVLEEDDLKILDTLSFGRRDNAVVGVVFHVQTDEIDGFSAGSDAADARLWDKSEISSDDGDIRPAAKRILSRFEV